MMRRNTYKQQQQRKLAKKTSSVVKKRGRWENEEKKAFLRGFLLYGRGKWKAIAKLIPHRTTIQVKTHAQMVLKKMDAGEDVFRILQVDHSDDCVAEDVPSIEQEDDDSCNVLNCCHDARMNIGDNESLLTMSPGRKLQRDKNEADPKNDRYVPRTLDDFLPPLEDSTTEEGLATPLMSSLEIHPPNLSPSSLLKLDRDHNHGAFAVVRDSMPIFHNHVDVQVAAKVLLQLSTPVIHDPCTKFSDKASPPSSRGQLGDPNHNIETLNHSSIIPSYSTAV